jgi:hypothetical protein
MKGERTKYRRLGDLIEETSFFVMALEEEDFNVHLRSLHNCYDFSRICCLWIKNIYLYVCSKRYPGSAKTTAYYAISPFIGAGLFVDYFL